MEKPSLKDAKYCVETELCYEICEECRFYGTCDRICDDVAKIKLKAIETIERIPQIILELEMMEKEKETKTIEIEKVVNILKELNINMGQ